MKDKTLGIPNLPNKYVVPLLGFAQSFNKLSPPAQRGSQTILTISDRGDLGEFVIEALNFRGP